MTPSRQNNETLFTPKTFASSKSASLESVLAVAGVCFSMDLHSGSEIGEAQRMEPNPLEVRPVVQKKARELARRMPSRRSPAQGARCRRGPRLSLHLPQRIGEGSRIIVIKTGWKSMVLETGYLHGSLGSGAESSSHTLTRECIDHSCLNCIHNRHLGCGVAKTLVTQDFKPQ